VLGVRRARRRRRRRRDRRFLALALLCAGLAGAAVVGALVTLWADPDVIPACERATLKPLVVGRTSLVYAAGGQLLGSVPAASHREPVPLRDMSPWLPRATVAVEDRRFWHHGGLDYEAIARAALADLRAGRAVQGGSTITQQLVRDRYLGGQGVTLARKLREACLAVQLERAWPKRRILQAYLNDVFYGLHAYGAEAAARTFFARRARSLTLPQAALLAGLPQAPSRFDPLRHPAAARARRNEVLQALRSARAISGARYRALVARPLGLRRGGRYRRIRARAFFGDTVRAMTSRYGSWRARRGGLRVRTTLDLRLQRLAQRALRSWLSSRSDPAGVLVAIKPRTGAVVAMATISPGRPRLQFNLASQSHRQAGSAFKVFTLAAALERGIPLSSVWHGPASLTIRSRRCLNANGAWVVHNFADEATGTMTLAQAIAHSVNTIFAQVALRVGPGRIVAVAHRMGVRSRLKPVCSITLGPEGVSPLEMTSAFATLAARGLRHPPALILQVTRPGGTVSTRRRPKGARALPRPVAAQMTSALTGVVRAGTGRAADPGRPAAGKTGTAEGFKDAWFCGYVAQLASCVWIGNPHAEVPMRDVDGFAQVVGGSVPARIWHDFMVRAMRGRRVVALPGLPASRQKGRHRATPPTTTRAPAAWRGGLRGRAAMISATSGRTGGQARGLGP
jgi:penicillin-binding protein 1A